jgi:hypothetical protein
MSRFTISHHKNAPQGNHYDLMIEDGKALRTWRIHHTNFESEQSAIPIPDHRVEYLDREGAVSGGRGSVRIWTTGTCEMEVWDDSVIQVRLNSEELHLRLRIFQEKDGPWKVVDATLKLRRIVARHLRGSQIEAAPPAGMHELAKELAGEEGRILSFITRYSRGEEVDWEDAEISESLRGRLQDEWIRWQHPWLEQGRLFHERLGRLGSAARKIRPGGA